MNCQPEEAMNLSAYSLVTWVHLPQKYDVHSSKSLPPPLTPPSPLTATVYCTIAPKGWLVIIVK